MVDVCQHTNCHPLSGDLGDLIRFRCQTCGAEWQASDVMVYGVPPYGRDRSALRSSDPQLAMRVEGMRKR